MFRCIRLQGRRSLPRGAVCEVLCPRAGQALSNAKCIAEVMSCAGSGMDITAAHAMDCGLSCLLSCAKITVNREVARFAVQAIACQVTTASLSRNL